MIKQSKNKGGFMKNIANNKTNKKKMLNLLMRDSILTAASEILQKSGPAGLTMEKVAAAAKIAKGTVYLYFKSKDDLLKEFVKKIKEPIMSEMIEIKMSDLHVSEKFEKIFLSLLRNIEKKLIFVRVLMRTLDMRENLKAFLRKDDENTIKLFEEILKEGIKKNEIIIDNPKYAAKIIFACLIFMIRERGEGFTKFMPVKKEVESFMQILNYGFKNRKEAEKVEK